MDVPLPKTKPAPESSHHIKKSPVLLIVRIMAVLILVNVAFGIVFGIAIFTSTGGEGVFTAVMGIFWLLHTIKFFFELYIIYMFIVPWSASTYYLSDGHLIEYSGTKEATEKIYDLNNLRELDLRQNWLGQMLNFGTIHGTVAASGYNDEFKLVDVANAKKYEQVLHGYLHQVGQG